MTTPQTPDEFEELFEDETLEELTDKIAASQKEAGKDLSEDDIKAAQARAKTIIQETREAQQLAKETSGQADTPLDGMEDMRALSLSIGLPVPRILFAQLVKATTSSTRDQKRDWIRKIMALSEIKATGCIQVDFLDNTTKEKNTAYMVLDVCGKDHDLGAQLDKVFSRVSSEKQEEIRKHLSMLIFLGRSAYGQLMVEGTTLLMDIAKTLPPSKNPFDPRQLVVDPTNTTLYLDIPGTRRVGIFVRLASELKEEAPNKKNS